MVLSSRVRLTTPLRKGRSIHARWPVSPPPPDPGPTADTSQTIDDFADQVMAVAADVAEPLHLVGFSWGGATALRDRWREHVVAGRWPEAEQSNGPDRFCVYADPAGHSFCLSVLGGEHLRCARREASV